MQVTLGKVIAASKSSDLLGISDRDTIIDYIGRALEIVQSKANWNPMIGTMDICSDCCGYVTLPSCVGTVLSVNIAGQPSFPRNAWYEYHVNGVGSQCGDSCGFYWDDKEWTATFQQLTNWSMLAAICEDSIDGNGSLELIVEGETMDGNYMQKQALTIPTTGPSLPGVRLKLLNGYAATDSAATYFKKITSVTKPVTRGYVKLVAFQPTQFSNAVTVGYYAPNETNPRYRRIKLSKSCKCARIRYRRAEPFLVNDYDIVPIASYQAMLDLLKAIRLRETGNIDVAELYEQKAVQLLNEVETVESGPASFGAIQVAPGFGIGTLDMR